MFKSVQKEPSSRHTRRFSQRMGSTRDRIAPVCASFCSWASLKSPETCSTINSNSCCDKWASIWLLEMTSRRVTTTYRRRRDRAQKMRRLRMGRLYRTFHSGKEDVPRSAPCTTSRPSNHDMQSRDNCLEHQNLDCKMSECTCPHYITRSNRSDLWKQSQSNSVESPTGAQVRVGMG